ncbi:MAG: hypothetical protein LUG16_02815 [Candidatus Gastranaerophilales bacterium]|nr:hypothetical protein [Candidatus Gastranaerophilales bacterium]
MEVSKISATSIPTTIANKGIESKGTIVNSNASRNKEKIVAALGGLAVAGLAALAICKHKKPELGIDEFKKIGKFDKGFAVANGKPFSGKITVPNKDGKTVMEYAKGQIVTSTRIKNESPVARKVYSQKDGAKIVEQYGYKYGELDAEPWIKTVFSTNGITSDRNEGYFGKLHSEVKKQPDKSILSTKEIGVFSDLSPRAWHKKTINTATGDVLDDKLVLDKHKFKSEPLVRETKDGVTTKNGITHAIRTEKFDENGNKIIKVDYNGWKKGFKLITITPEGKRTVLDKTRRSFDLL